MSNPRWTTACHEAGHALGAIVFGGVCRGVVIYDDGGQASIDELIDNREIYAIAAGPAAERLAEEYGAPELMQVEMRQMSLDEIEMLPLFKSSPRLAYQMARTSATRKHVDSDSRFIALWAINRFEDQPDRWQGRVELAHRMAAEVIERNADKIIRIARALYVRGSLSETEILELLKAE